MSEPFSSFDANETAFCQATRVRGVVVDVRVVAAHRAKLGIWVVAISLYVFMAIDHQLTEMGDFKLGPNGNPVRSLPDKARNVPFETARVAESITVWLSHGGWPR